MGTREAIQVDSGHQHKGGGSAGVRIGNLVFLSAIRGVDPDTQEVVEDPEKQYHQAFDNAGAALAAVGATLADIARVGIFMKDVHGDRPVLNKVWRERLPEPRPARFAVQVSDFGASGDASRALFDITAVVPE